MTGIPIQIKPQFNFMIGPSQGVLINMGARYAPCMHNVEEIQGSDIPVNFLCPNATKWEETCPLSIVCGFGGNVENPVFDGDVDQRPEPNQWFRWILPMFLHAGIIHIAFNMLLQLTLAREMEMAIGSLRFFLVYVSAGIFGFVMGGNFSPPAVASTGASGAIFGILALNLLDLLYSWKDRKSPLKDLAFIIVDMVISFVLGLLPGLDNFAHIGGFLMGLALGISVLHSPNALRLKIGQDATYAAVPEGQAGPQPFHKNPVGFFKGRKPLWWVWWLVRAGALILVVVVFIVLLNNFYNVGHTCDWCKYLSCIVSFPYSYDKTLTDFDTARQQLVRTWHYSEARLSLASPISSTLKKHRMFISWTKRNFRKEMLSQCTASAFGFVVTLIEGGSVTGTRASCSVWETRTSTCQSYQSNHCNV